MISSTMIIVFGVFGTVFCGGCLLMLLFDRYQVHVDERLREIPKDGSGGNKFGGSLYGRNKVALPEKWSARLNRLVSSGTEGRQKVQSRLLQAGIYNLSALSTFFVARVIFMGAPLLLGFLAGWRGFVDPRLGILWGCVGAVIGMMLPSLWLERKIRHRHCLLHRSLADFLDLMIVCLESGLSLPGTIQRVTDELRIAHPELAGELNIVQRDIELGATIDTAFRRFADRSGFEGIRSLSTFMRESQRFGTQLTTALRLHADMLRSQRECAAEETAQKAAVKILFPTLLLILPAVFVVVAGPALIQIQQAFAK